MENIYKKSFLVLSLISTLGLSADWTPTFGACSLPDGYEKPVEAQTKTQQAAVIAASVVANAVAVAGMITADDIVKDNVFALCSSESRMARYMESVIIIAARIGMVELSNHIINKLDLKTNKLCLYGFTFNGIAWMIERDVLRYMKS